jgi:hypothetical protein
MYELSMVTFAFPSPIGVIEITPGRLLNLQEAESEHDPQMVTSNLDGSRSHRLRLKCMSVMLLKTTATSILTEAEEYTSSLTERSRRRVLQTSLPLSTSTLNSETIKSGEVDYSESSESNLRISD